jgi:hypothetical protein
MNKRAMGLSLGVLALAAAACASDPNKKVNEAQDRQLESERKSEQAAAEHRKDYRTDEAQEQRKETISAGVPGDHADQKRLKADAKMAEARQVALAEAKARLEKCDAKANELRAQINKSGGKATTSSRDSLTTVDTQRIAAKMAIERLADSDDEGFKRANDDADYQLDTLEAYVKRASKEVDDFK